MFFKKNNEENTNNIENSTETEIIKKSIQYLRAEQGDLLHQIERGMMPRSQIDKTLELYLKKIVKDENIQEIISSIKENLWGYSILKDLIEDPDISDIKITSKNHVRIKVKGKRKDSGIKFESDEAVNNFISKVALQNKVNIADINALTTFMDKDSSEKFRLRITIATQYVSSTKTGYLHIRKIPKYKKTVEELIDDGLLTKEVFEYLVKCIKNGDIMVFSGKGASGKTTLMNLLIDYINENKSGLVIQENDELHSKHPDLMFLNVKEGKGEGRISYTLKELSRIGLLMDLDWYVIGEIKGDEAIYFLNAAYTGHACMCSSHGSSQTESMNKLVDYMKYGSDYSRQDIMIMLKNLGIKVIFNKDFNLRGISEIVGYDQDKDDFIYKDIYRDSEFVKEV